MKVLIACEYSARVRGAFRRRGHDAWSCDLLASEDDSPYHIRGPVESVAMEGWDLLIAHPPCTDLAVSGARHFAAKRADGRQQAALDFVRYLMALPIKKKGIENPVSIISSEIRRPDQIVHPWQFGHPESKATCLWLENLPLLVPTNNVHAEMMKLPVAQRNRVHHMPPGPDRWKERSRTYPGIAEAMASQWGDEDLW